MSNIEEQTNRESLLRNVKKEVKYLMELSVSRKAIHEDSSCLTSFSASIDACLQHGLKRTSIFRANTTLNLLVSVGKRCPEAQLIVDMCEDYDQIYCDPASATHFSKLEKNNNKLHSKQSTVSHMTSDSKSSFKILSKKIFSMDEKYLDNRRSYDKKLFFSPTFHRESNCYKFLWIRLALLNKTLGKIIEFLINNSNISQFYMPHALCADAVDGAILCSLLVGPCALEFTRIKLFENTWQDPHADELLLRHRMHSGLSPIRSDSDQTQNETTTPLKTIKSTNQNKSFKEKKGGENNTSIKIRLGQSASVLAKRKASISALDDISNVSSNSKAGSTAATSPLRFKSSTLKAVLSEEEIQTTNQFESTPVIAGAKPSGQKLCMLDNNSNQSYYKVQMNGSSGKSAKEYVESLHQNSKSQLIYGKNNVVVKQKDIELVGYLSMHVLSSIDGLVLKWTPNQMMNNDESLRSVSGKLVRQSTFWEYAVHVDLNTIVYLHCHRDKNEVVEQAELVLVGQDGVQHSPLYFPTINSFVQFLICFETSLLPTGKLEPPIVSFESFVEAKNDSQNDFVFRIINSKSNVAFTAIKNSTGNYSPTELTNSNPEINLRPLSGRKSKDFKLGSLFTTPSITDSSAEPSPIITQSSRIHDNTRHFRLLNNIEQLSPIDFYDVEKTSQNIQPPITSVTPRIIKGATVRGSLKKLCETMSKQILTRAFYGWLTYHRNLKTVGMHLTGLVNTAIVESLEQADEESETNTVPLRNSPSYLFKCIKELKELNLTDENYEIKVEASQELCLNFYLMNNKKIDKCLWESVFNKSRDGALSERIEKIIYKLVYLVGVDENIRDCVWPFLLEHFSFRMTTKQRELKEMEARERYVSLVSEWQPFEQYITLREQKQNKHLVSKKKMAKRKIDEYLSPSYDSQKRDLSQNEDDGLYVNNDSVFFESPNLDTVTLDDSASISMLDKTKKLLNKILLQRSTPAIQSSPTNTSQKNDDSGIENKSYLHSPVINETQVVETPADEDLVQLVAKYLVEKAIRNARCSSESGEPLQQRNILNFEKQSDVENYLSMGRSISQSAAHRHSTNICLSNMTLVNSFALNIHRIDKDVTRCDRNYWYFMNNDNLKKLKNIVYTYVWENLDIGYIQGMCDLVAPLLVIFNDESISYACFKQLMIRMSSNFPHGSAMDQNFSSMRLLIQILDADLYEHMYHRGDFTHFYFSYRWFLLDFKRELIYDDVFTVWETIWAAKFVSSQHFYLFIALALVETYRDIIIDNNMDFTDIIKFFNEMAEKHKTKEVLRLARSLVTQLQKLISNRHDSLY